MGPTHGARVIGQKAYDKQVAEAAAQVATHGGEHAMYGPRVLGTEPVTEPVEEPKAPARPTIAKLQETLATDPEQLWALGTEELASEAPRKGALTVLLVAAKEAGDSAADLANALRSALER